MNSQRRFVGLLAITVMASHFGCGSGKLEPSKECHVTNTQNVVAATPSCFEIPRGEFRGVLWPSRSAPQFSVWVLRATGFGPLAGREEIHLTVDAPGVPTDWEEGKQQQLWQVAPMLGTATRYRVIESGSNRAFDLEVPETDVPFSFSILKGGGRQLLVFLNPMERLVQRGVFGFLSLPGGAG